MVDARLDGRLEGARRIHSSPSPTSRWGRATRSVFVLTIAAAATVGAGGSGARTAAIVPLVGCSSEEQAQGLFDVPASLDGLAGETFFNQPFPSDLRKVDGKVRFHGFPNPRRAQILDTYVDTIDQRFDGFSPVAAGYLRFSHSLDPATLPKDPAESLEENASVQLIDVDPESPEYGQRHRISLFYQDQKGIYWPEHTLAFLPSVGFPLRFHTRYALVVNEGVRGADGSSAHASGELREVLGISDATTEPRRAARDAFAPAVGELKKLGIDLEHIAHFTVFTTDDPTVEYFAAARAMKAAVPAPTADASKWNYVNSKSGYDLYEGAYGPSPNYQAGTVPYASPADGGNFEDEDGIPKVQNTFDLRFALTVPDPAQCPEPPNGYPIVMYAHGTGGNFESFVREKVASSLAAKCLAAMGVDQIFHGTRPGAPDPSLPPDQVETKEEILFFNFNNIEAARTNIRQSGLDELQRARLFTESHMTVPASISHSGVEVHFDASKLMFFGHSQGSLNGPLFLAASEDARGGVLSGASGFISITLLEKTEPAPSIADLVKGPLFLDIPEDHANELNIFHPAMSLAQSIVDAVDPINYARFLVQQPTGASKSIYQTEGIRADGTGDSYAPPRGGEALALATGLELQEPVVLSPPDAAWGGLEHVEIPTSGLSGNLAGGAASGVLAQWSPAPNDDGHFVVFDIPAAAQQAAGFLRNLADEPHGRVPAP